MKRCAYCGSRTLGRRHDEFGEYVLGMPLVVCARFSKHLDDEPFDDWGDRD